ncbi:MAG: E3 binding domain-containing protein, partial [Myxococcota bacterium]|nr:E3 binding domain-containing protein [Myxococcota bacterium]
MAIEIRMPEIPADVDHADLLAWLVKPGDPVAQGDPILEIETDKSTVEIEAPASGILAEIQVPAGSVDVAAGTVLGLIEESVRDAADIVGAQAPPSPAVQEEPEPVPAAARPPESESAPGIRSTALARRVAEREGIDLSALEGSGLHGRITRADVEAGRAGRGRGVGAMLWLEADCNADALMEAAEHLADDSANPLIPLEAWFVRAAALGAQQVPEFAARSSRDGDDLDRTPADIRVMGGAHPGAGSRIRQAHRKGLAALSAELSAPQGGEPEEGGEAEAPIALAHLDLEGVDRHWPAPPPGARASLGFARPRRGPVGRKNGVEVGYVLTLTL